jgi:anionic cell wall polymer biosynthesis LytR-Cps2A-Psr (LCP) family protein
MTGLPPLPAHLDPRGKHRDRTQTPGLGWRHVRLFTKVVSALLSAFLLAAFGVYWYEYRTVSGGFQRLSIFGASVPKPAKDIDGKDQNILIVGNDDRETATNAELAALGTGRDGGSLNTDTMMIVHVPADGSKATLISLPRDSYVDIPGHGKYKLNSAYPDGYTSAA